MDSEKEYDITVPLRKWRHNRILRIECDYQKPYKWRQMVLGRVVVTRVASHPIYHCV